MKEENLVEILEKNNFLSMKDGSYNKNIRGLFSLSNDKNYMSFEVNVNPSLTLITIEIQKCNVKFKIIEAIPDRIKKEEDLKIAEVLLLRYIEDLVNILRRNFNIEFFVENIKTEIEELHYECDHQIGLLNKTINAQS